MLHQIFGERHPLPSGGPEDTGCQGGQTGLLLRLTKEPDDRFVNERRFVDWVSADGQAEDSRRPQPSTSEYPFPGVFWVGGRKYHSVSELRIWALDRKRQLYRDRYGRVFAEVRERFPCFDSYDYAHENRYYHWLYLTEKEKLFLVYYEDEGKKLTVTEDVGEISGRVWREMVSLGWVEEQEVQTMTALPAR